MKPERVLPAGYASLARGHLANVVTCLEMTAPPPARARRQSDPRFELRRLDPTDIEGYRALFRRVGEPWRWFSRVVMPAETLRRILADPRVEAFALCEGGGSIGLLELDFRHEAECELAFFGLVPEAIGKGAGRFLMDRALALAWARPIRRLWVHTCTFDHPSALAFYRRSGFRPYAFQVEVHEDPRLTGHLPRSAAPHVPLLE